MTRFLISLYTLAAALGAALLVRAYALELGLEKSGMYSWYGITDPNAERGLMLLGILLLASGLAVIVLSALERLSADGPVSPTGVYAIGRRSAA